MTEKLEIKSCFRFLILSQSFKTKNSPSFDKLFVKLRAIKCAQRTQDNSLYFRRLFFLIRKFNDLKFKKASKL